jgi:hypothetical protein
MTYLCLIYEDEKELEAMSRAQLDAFRQEYAVFTDAIRSSGHYIDSTRVKGAECATTVRRRNGHLTMADGPFAPTREQLAGYYVIEARDLSEALQVASRIPSARTGSVEVRPAHRRV